MSQLEALWPRVRAQLIELGNAVREKPLLSALILLVCVPCALLFSIQVASLQAGIMGIHDWRQGETYSVAYLFVSEGASFFKPRHAWRNDLTGIVGMEAPIYPWLLSLLMRVFGDAPSLGRVLNWVLFVLAFGLQGKRIAKLEGAPYALGFLVMVAFCPAALAEFRQIQPDPMMASLAVMAAVFFQDHGRDGERKSYLLGLGFYTVSLLTKPIAIAILPAMALFTLCGPRRPTLRAAVLRCAGFLLPLALMMAWDRWAHHLVEAYMNGNMLISIDHKPEQMWREMQNADARRLILIGLVQVYTCCVSLFPAVLVGIPYALERATRGWVLPYLAWFAGMVVISLAFSSRYFANWYYMLLFVPPLCFFGAHGLGALFEVLTLRARDRFRVAVALTVVLAMVAVVPLLDPIDYTNISTIPEKLALHLRHGVVRGNVYWILLLLSAVVAVSASCLPWRRVPTWLLTPVLAGLVLWAMYIPYRDQRQSVRWYTSEEYWISGKRDDREVQAAVDRFSTERDLFVANGFNPSLLARAHRVGFADDPGTVESLGPDWYRDRGARFFLNWWWQVGAAPPRFRDLPVIARGTRWELRCLDPKGCPELAAGK